MATHAYDIFNSCAKFLSVIVEPPIILIFNNNHFEKHTRWGWEKPCNKGHIYPMGICDLFLRRFGRVEWGLGQSLRMVLQEYFNQFETNRRLAAYPANRRFDFTPDFYMG
jgi:hypothetical protein